MSLFRLEHYKNTRWLIAAIALATVLIMSSSVIVYAKSGIDNKQALPKNTVADKVFVDKSARVLQLLDGDKVIKSYHIALGGNPIGHKQQEGDQRTPIGSYTLDYKNEKSQYYRSIHVSYPNAADKARAKERGVSPGGAIMIHGQKNGFGALAALTQQRDWTAGCIAVTDDEMDEIMATVKVGTAIEIVE